MSWFCTHDWKVLDKTVQKSMLELAMQARAPLEGSSRLGRGTIMVVCACNKCGKIKRFVTRT